MHKDLELAIDLAAETGLRLPVSTAAQDFLVEATAAGFGDADFACVAEVLRQQAAGQTPAQLVSRTQHRYPPTSSGHAVSSGCP
jgi:hypothetical protein